MDKGQIFGFLTELYESLVEQPSLQFPSGELFNEEMQCLETNVIINWRERVDSATVDLASRWIQEEFVLESTLPKWAELYYEDPDLSAVLRNIGILVSAWKTEITDALYQDPSIFSLPQELTSPDKLPELNEKNSITHEPLPNELQLFKRTQTEEVN